MKLLLFSFFRARRHVSLLLAHSLSLYRSLCRVILFYFVDVELSLPLHPVEGYATPSKWKKKHTENISARAGSHAHRFYKPFIMCLIKRKYQSNSRSFANRIIIFMKALENHYFIIIIDFKHKMVVICSKLWINHSKTLCTHYVPATDTFFFLLQCMFWWESERHSAQINKILMITLNGKEEKKIRRKFVYIVRNFVSVHLTFEHS